MIYVERLLQSLTQAIACKSSFSYYNIASTSRQHPYMLTSNNAHRVILTALLLAHKYSMDVAYPFSLIARIVGVTSSELKILESEFLVFVKYELYVSQDLYNKYEEVFTQWPEMENGEQVEQDNNMEENERKSKVTREVKYEERKEKDEEEEKKVIDDPVEVQEVVKAGSTDEDIAESQFEEVEKEKKVLEVRHERLVFDTPSSTIQNLDIRSHFYEDDPEQNSDDDEDTEMTIYGRDSHN
jgi:hypothetical protein